MYSSLKSAGDALRSAAFLPDGPRIAEAELMAPRRNCWTSWTGLRSARTIPQGKTVEQDAVEMSAPVPSFLAEQGLNLCFSAARVESENLLRDGGRAATGQSLSWKRFLLVSTDPAHRHGLSGRVHAAAQFAGCRNWTPRLLAFKVRHGPKLYAIASRGRFSTTTTSAAFWTFPSGLDELMASLKSPAGSPPGVTKPSWWTRRPPATPSVCWPCRVVPQLAWSLGRLAGQHRYMTAIQRGSKSGWH